MLSGLRQLFAYPYTPIIFWAVTAGCLVALLIAIIQLSKWGMGMFFKVAAHAFLTLFVSEIVFILTLALGDLYRLGVGTGRLISGNHFALPERNTNLIAVALILFFFSVLVFIYGIIKGKYAYRVIRHTLYFEDLPQAFDGFTITQISDVHAGSFTNAAEVQKGIDMVNAQKSDLFVFTGDLVNNKASEIKPWINYFSKIKAPYGQFSVLGNHDYGDYVKWESEADKRANLQQLKNYHTELGFRLLLDEHIALHKDGAKLILLGIENWGLGFGERGDLEKALRNTDAADFKVLLSHDPSHWEMQVKQHPNKIQLTLAGHTHGMQFGIEAFGIKWSPVKLRYKHWAGIKSEFGRILNINRGFGFIGFSGRIGIWPEITVIELKKG